MSIDEPVLSLDILGGDDVAGSNCVLRQNKTTLLGRGPYDYCQSMRDEMVVNKGYTLPPYYQEEWAFNKKNYWTPKELLNLETWFSPEYFHAETNNPTLCIQMENQSTTDIASGDATQNTTVNMATLTTTAGRHRGLTVVDFDGTGDRYLLDAASDWNTGTANWFCCIMLHGSHNDTDDVQHIVQKGAKFELTHDWSGTNRNAVFNYNDGSTSATLTAADGAMMSELPSIFTFGRNASEMFLRVLSPLYGSLPTTPVLITGSGGRLSGSFDQTSKPKIGYETGIGTAKFYDGEFVELIFVNDNSRPTSEATDAYMEKVEGYLAHKYGVSKEILTAAHTYSEHPPRET